MTLRLYDSLRRSTNDVEPLTPGQLGLYVCGPTVYGPVHVGNARPFVVAMTLARHLRRTGWEVRVVSNLTDINDKIYTAAQAEGIESRDLAERESARYLDDTSRLGLGRPDVEPKVTESLPEIVEMIEGLIAGGHAYASDGDVYFRVADFPSYGALSGQKIDEMQPEEITSKKQAPLDFALWKAQKPGEDAAWESPWGMGRPGWHIECSAMAMSALGEEIDIHGGGIDLKFPHHENERAQSEAMTGRPFARTWLHNGMLRFGGDKMSKSLGNIDRLSDALDREGNETLLSLFARAQYRSPLDYSPDSLEDARKSNDRLREALRRAARIAGDVAPAEGGPLATAAAEADARFRAALDDDFGTPEGLAALFDLVRVVNAATDAGDVSPADVAQARAILIDCLWVLGLDGLGATADGPPVEAVALMQEREAARATKDFARADAIRDELKVLGWVVQDLADGPELQQA
ncbi:MAG: cysteine--tRNA ligase [Actinobacteria bacterium]|nr:cysteine--tRNA ligase [Actinomycetota bacterium]